MYYIHLSPGHVQIQKFVQGDHLWSTKICQREQQKKIKNKIKTKIKTKKR